MVPVFAVSNIPGEVETFYNRWCKRGRKLEIVGAVCYLIDKTSELDGKISQGGGALRVFDNQGDELGIYMDDDKVFLAELNRYVKLENHGTYYSLTDRVNAYYTSNDCSGTAYIDFNDDALKVKLNEIISIGPGKYFIVTKDYQRTNIVSYSYLRWDTASNDFICQTWAPPFDGVIELTPIDLGINEPINTPLEYRFE